VVNPPHKGGVIRGTFEKEKKGDGWGKGKRIDECERKNGEGLKKGESRGTAAGKGPIQRIVRERRQSLKKRREEKRSGRG